MPCVQVEPSLGPNERPTRVREAVTAFDVHCALLATALRGRTPEFIEEQNLPEQGMFWQEESLPRVFVAPDVWAALQEAVALASSGGR